jgi:hypothetical protein
LIRSNFEDLKSSMIEPARLGNLKRGCGGEKEG